eukprot:1182684-Prorocentrum_minimum.AAC.2
MLRAPQGMVRHLTGLGVHRGGQHAHARRAGMELARVEEARGHVVPEAHAPVPPAGHGEVGLVARGEAAGVPHAGQEAVLVLDDVVVLLEKDALDFHVLADEHLLQWDDGGCGDVLVWFGVHDSGEVPGLDETVESCGDNFLVLQIEGDALDICVVAVFTSRLHENDLDQPGVPKQKFTRFRSRQDLAIWQLHITGNVAQLLVTELSKLSLQFEAGESGCHLPESDVTLSTGGQLTLEEFTKRHIEDVLCKRLTAKDHRLLLPVPHCQHEVWEHPDGR